MKPRDRLSLCWKLLHGKRVYRDQFLARPDDVYLVSYPKSGNTWLRFLAANLLSMELPVGFDTIEGLVPDIHKNRDQILEGLTERRILKSHDYFRPDYAYVAYIVRDPRDVAVSYYHYRIKTRSIPEGYPLGEFVQGFVAGEWDEFGTWRDHVGSWLGARKNDPHFLLIRYEDLLSDPRRWVSELAVLLGIDPSPERVDRAIRLSSKEQLRKLERAQGDKWVTTKGTDPDKPFIRKGQAGSWCAELSPAQAGLIELAWGDRMRECGYAPETVGHER